MQHIWLNEAYNKYTECEVPKFVREARLQMTPAELSSDDARRAEFVREARLQMSLTPTERWTGLIHRFLRIQRLKRLWGHLGHFLRDIKSAAKQG